MRAAQAELRHLARLALAVIDGVCVGGGCALSLACELRFAADSARFAITPARLGLADSFADTAQLVEKVGPARAKDIVFSGRLLPAPGDAEMDAVHASAFAGDDFREGYRAFLEKRKPEFR